MRSLPGRTQNRNRLRLGVASGFGNHLFVGSGHGGAARVPGGSSKHAFYPFKD